MGFAAYFDAFNHVYWWGVLGSCVVELAAVAKGMTELKGFLPPQYKKPAFIIVKLAFAIICAGTLAVILGATGIFTAFYIGASAPLILDRFAKGLDIGNMPESNGG